jgi:hypothetical protein
MAADRSKAGPTPKRSVRQARNRFSPVTISTLTTYAQGIRSVPSSQCLDVHAVRDAVNECSRDELHAIAQYSQAEDLEAWMDIFALRYPEDERWDDWRTYRSYELADAN